MKKITLIAAFIILIGKITIAQNVKLSFEDRSGYMQHVVNWNYTERHDFPDGSNFIQIEGTGVKPMQLASILYNGQKHALIIHRMDASGNEIETNKLENGERNFGPVPSESIEFDGKILLFYFRYIRKDSMRFYVSELDRTSLQLTNTTLLFSYAQGNSGLFSMTNEYNRRITLKTSPDNTKLLAIIRGQKEEFFTCLFEKDMRLTRKKNVQGEGAGGMDINSVFIDNTGNALVVFTKDDDNTTFLPYKIVKKFLILTSSNASRLMGTESLGAETEFHDIRLALSKDKAKLYLFGDYKGSLGNAGIWLTEIPTDNFKIGKARLIPYPADFMKRVYTIGFGYRKKSEYGLPRTDYDLVEFVNGDLAICGSPLVSEEIGSDRHSMVMHYAGPVIVSFLAGKEDVVFSMIPRHQNYYDGSTSIFLSYQDKLLILYTDYKKNINEPMLPDGVHEKGGYYQRNALFLACGILKKDGTVETRKPLSDMTGTNYFAFNMAVANKLSEKMVVIPSSALDTKSVDRKVAVVTVEE